MILNLKLNLKTKRRPHRLRPRSWPFDPHWRFAPRNFSLRRAGKSRSATQNALLPRHTMRKWPRVPSPLCCTLSPKFARPRIGGLPSKRPGQTWLFDPGKSAFCTICRALSDTPISVADGRDLGPLRASQKVHDNEAQEHLTAQHPSRTLEYSL